MSDREKTTYFWPESMLNPHTVSYTLQPCIGNNGIHWRTVLDERSYTLILLIQKAVIHKTNQIQNKQT